MSNNSFGFKKRYIFFIFTFWAFILYSFLLDFKNIDSLYKIQKNFPNLLSQIIVLLFFSFVVLQKIIIKNGQLLFIFLKIDLNNVSKFEKSLNSKNLVRITMKDGKEKTIALFLMNKPSRILLEIYNNILQKNKVYIDENLMNLIIEERDMSKNKHKKIK